MLAGIGVLILVTQFHVMLDGKPFESGIDNLLGMPRAVIESIQLGDHHLKAGAIGALTILVIAGWAYVPKSWRMMPAPLVGVIAAMLAAFLLGLTDIAYVNVPNYVWSTVVLPTPENLIRIVETPMLVGAISLALIASVETLLCATAIDQMHRGPRTRYNQELSAQGVGNALCGLLGALP